MTISVSTSDLCGHHPLGLVERPGISSIDVQLLLHAFDLLRVEIWDVLIGFHGFSMKAPRDLGALCGIGLFQHFDQIDPSLLILVVDAYEYRLEVFEFERATDFKMVAKQLSELLDRVLPELIIYPDDTLRPEQLQRSNRFHVTFLPVEQMPSSRRT